MSGREVPFDAEAKCDHCGVLGAYDFMGDILCLKCAGLEVAPPALTKEK